MKLLLLSDIHSKKSVLKNLNQFLSKNKFDGVVCAGDIVSTPDPLKDDFLNAFVHLIVDLHSLPLFAIHGNNEDEANIKFLFDKKVSIHNIAKKFKGFTFFGIGGWGEDVVKDKFEKLPNNNLIFVTHIPPRRLTEDEKEKLKAKKGPLVHICGHLHGRGGVWKIGLTLVIKVPTAEWDKAAILELPQRKIKFIDIK
jgi:Icc-related predicted phosphoesterase